MPRFIQHHLHFPHFHVNLKSNHNMRMLYGIRVLRELKGNLIFFFIPLFLFQTGPKISFLMGFNFSDFQKGMIAVGLYFIMYRIAMLLSVVPVGKFIATKLGFKNAFIVSRVLAVIVMVLYHQSTTHYWLVFAAAFLDGIEGAFFWPLFYNIFGSSAKKKEVGKSLGFLQFALQFVAMAAPALGGLIIVMLGYDKLFMTGMLLTMSGVAFAISMHDGIVTAVPSFKELFAWLKEKRFRQLSMTYVGRYINDSVLTIWPLYVYLLLQGVERVGFLYSMSLFIAMLLSFFIGFYIDHNKSKKPFFLSGGFLSLLWFLRMRAVDLWSVVFVDVTNRLVSSFHWMFYDAILIRRGRGEKSYPFFIYREVTLSLGGILVWLIFTGLFIFSGDWRMLFLLAAMGTISSLFINDERVL